MSGQRFVGGAIIVAAILGGAAIFGLGRNESVVRADGASPTEKTRPGLAKYRRYCQDCHGADGAGSDMRPDMSTIPDFTSAAWQETRRDTELLVGILEGKGSQMPAFNGRLTIDQA